MSKFQVGDRVGKVIEADYRGKERRVKYNEEEDRHHYGTVSAITITGQLVIDWDSMYLASNQRYMGPQNPEHFLPEEEVKRELSRLEQEFNDCKPQVVAKVQAAAALLLEANQIAGKVNYELREMYDAYRPLIDAMGQCGWNTSSINC